MKTTNFTVKNTLLIPVEDWDKGLRVFGATFLESTLTFYSMAILNKEPQIIYRALQKDGWFAQNFSRIKPTKMYTGLLDWKNRVYGFRDHRFYELSLSEKVTEKREVFCIKTNLLYLLLKYNCISVHSKEFYQL